MTEWSMTRSTGTSGLIFFGSPPSLFMRVAHGGEVDHGRNAGEVLHQHAGGAERDLPLGLALGLQPLGDGEDVLLVTDRPSSKRNRFSRSTFSEKGKLEMPARPFFSASFSE